MTRPLDRYFPCGLFSLMLLIAPVSTHAQSNSPVSPISATASPVTPVADTSPISAVASPDDAALRNEYANLKSEMRRAAEENIRAQNELDAAIETLKRENAELKKTVTNKENERNVLIQKLAAAQIATQERDKARDNIGAITTELTAARLNIDTLNAQIQKLTTEKEQLVTDKQQLAADAAKETAKAGRETIELTEKLENAEKTISTLHINLTAARQGSMALTEQIQALTSENQKLMARFDAAAEKHAKELAIAQKQTADARAESATLRETTTNLRAQLETGSSTAKVLADAQAENKTLASKLAEALAKIDAITIERDKAVLAREDAAKQRDTVNTERDTANAARDFLQTQMKTAEASLADMTRQRDEARQRMAEIEKQSTENANLATEDFRKQLAATEEKQTTALRSKQEELDQALKKQIEAEAANTSLNERLLLATSQLAEATKRAEGYEKTLDQLSIARENLRQMQIQSAQVADENVRLRTQLALGAQPPPAARVASATPSRPSQTAQPPPPAASVNGTLSTTRTVQTSQGTLVIVSATAPLDMSTEASKPIATTTATPPPPPETRTHTVGSGETLWSIARRYYGSSEQWTVIYEANNDQLKSPDALKLGMKLRIP